MNNQDKRQYPGCPQEVVKDLGWCRSHYPGNPTDLNQDEPNHVDEVIKKVSDSQDELREAVKRFCRTDEAADNLVSFINAHTQKAVETAEAVTADIEFKAGINYATMSGEYVTKAELEKAVTEARIDELEMLDWLGEDVKPQPYALRGDLWADAQNALKHELRSVVGDV